MLRTFTKDELHAVLWEARNNPGEFIKTIVSRHRPSGKPFNQDEQTLFYRGLSHRFLQGPVLWLTPHLVLPLAAINQPSKDQVLLFNLHPNNHFFINELNTSNHLAFHINRYDFGDDHQQLKSAQSMTIFFDVFEHHNLDSIVNFLKACKSLQSLKVFWSGRDIQAQKLLKNFLQEHEQTGICWFDALNTIEVVITPASLFKLIEHYQQGRTRLETLTNNLVIVRDDAALELLIQSIHQECERRFSHDPTQPNSTDQVEALAAIDELKATADKSRESSHLKNSETTIQRRARAYLRAIQKAYPFVNYLTQLKTTSEPTKVLLAFYAYLSKIPKDDSNPTLTLALHDNFQAVRPKVWSQPEIYDAWYSYGGMKNIDSDVKPQSRTLKHKIVLRGVSHHARHLYCAAMVEFLMGTLAQQTSAKIRWLDIGCGQGKIMHLVNPEKVSVDNFECIGVDVAQAKIDVANAFISQNRRFYCANAFDLPDEIMQGGFHLVTLFEFLEHVEDPVSMVGKAAELSIGYVMAGSPLNEQIAATQAREHLWSFSQRGYEQLFTANNLSLVLSNAMKIGQYINNHDWVTCAASRHTKLSDPTIAP